MHRQVLIAYRYKKKAQRIVVNGILFYIFLSNVVEIYCGFREYDEEEKKFEENYRESTKKKL